MSKETKSKLSAAQREVKWETNLKRAKEVLSRNEINQMEVAALALEVCEISWGGAQHRSKFTLKNFAEDIGVSAKTLSNWVAVRVTVYDKLEPETRAKAQFTPLHRVAGKVARDTPIELVREIYQKYTEASDIDKTLRHYLATLRSVHYSFSLKGAATSASTEVMQEYLFYCRKISYQIKKEHPKLEAKHNNIAGDSGKVVISAAAALLGRDEREKGRSTIRDESGHLIKVTPKDRDIVAYLRKQSGKWVSPTEIGMKAHGLSANSASSWAYRTLNKFSGTKLIERNNKGHYRWVGPNELAEA